MTVSVSGVTFDCNNPDVVVAFWEHALRWRRHGHMLESDDGTLRIESVAVPESKAVKNRVHLDLHADDLDAEIHRLVGLGASIAWEEEFPPEWPFRNVVLRDVEDNEFCVGNGDPAEVKRLLGG